METLPKAAKARRALLALTAAASMIWLTGEASAQAAGRQYVIRMNNMSYGPIPKGLRVGDTVVFLNHDSVAHTATARDHSFDLRIPPGKSAALILQKPGSIPFYCIYHAPMRGVLSVVAK